MKNKVFTIDEAGVDAVKFLSFATDNLIGLYARAADYLLVKINGTKYQQKMLTH